MAPSQRSVNPRPGRGESGAPGLIGIRAPDPPLPPWSTWTLVGHRRFSGAPMSQGPGVYSQGSSPTALIQKGDWRGSESIRDLSMRTAGALAVPMSRFPTDTSVLGCEKKGRAIDRGQLNGAPHSTLESDVQALSSAATGATIPAEKPRANPTRNRATPAGWVQSRCLLWWVIMKSPACVRRLGAPWVASVPLTGCA